MLPENTLAIIARNETWQGVAATEPYECGWAKEAVIFVRALAAHGLDGEWVPAQVQISPDGMHWVDEGTSLVLPGEAGETAFAKLAHFGGWLRLATELPDGAGITVIVSLHLKA